MTKFAPIFDFMIRPTSKHDDAKRIPYGGSLVWRIETCEGKIIKDYGLKEATHD